VSVLKIALMLMLAAIAGPSSSRQHPREWRDYGGSPDSSRFIAATEISASNVQQLEVAWAYQSGATDFNPIVARGVVYGRGPNGSFVALDAATGKQIWSHEGVKGFNSRGVNYWESRDGTDRRLIFSANNTLEEIDAKTGQSIASFGVNGRVDLRVGLDRDPETVDQQSRIPGRVFENLLILGSATNQEYASAPGDIRAFDVRTGALVWTFHTVPRPGEFGYDTWPEGAWKTVGGANNWGEQSIDEARGIVFVPTASPKFNFYGGHRKGANLFGDCLLALDVRTGKRLWHFQTVHHDIWDLDNNSAPQLTTIRRAGRTIDVVAMASKTGYLYVFDRITGEPIWPIEERPVPQHTDVPGEVLWPTQPIPTSPPPFSRQKFTVDDLNPYILTPTERDEFRQRIVKARNDGPFTPIGFDEVLHMPGNQGGSNWGSTAANPTDGSVYVIGFNVPVLIRLLKPGEVRPARNGRPPEVVKEGQYLTDGFGLHPTIVNPPYTTLTAYDLNTGEIIWQVPNGDHPPTVAAGGPANTGGLGARNGMVVTKGGLVFHAGGDGKFRAYDQASGKVLWSAPFSGNAPGVPVSYESKGRQYVAVIAGQGGGGTAGTNAPPASGMIAYALKRR
jgi:quinate dehydrogenase (quinone)